MKETIEWIYVINVLNISYHKREVGKMSEIESYIPVEDWLQLHTVFTLYRDERLWQEVRNSLSDHLAEIIHNLNNEEDK